MWIIWNDYFEITPEKPPVSYQAENVCVSWNIDDNFSSVLSRYNSDDLILVNTDGLEYL